MTTRRGIPDRKHAPRSRRWRALAAAIVILFGATTGLAGYRAWQAARIEPEAVAPAGLDGLEPQLRACLQEHIEAVRQAPRDTRRHAELGLVYEANACWPEARRSFEQAVALDPDAPLAKYHLAITLRELGDFPGSLAELRRLTVEHPRFAPAQCRLGDALLEAGLTTEAEPAFRRAIDLAPRSPFGYVGLGECRLHAGAYAEAEQLLTRAVQLQPGYRMARYLLGQAYRGLGRTEDADRQMQFGADGKRMYMSDPWTDLLPDYARTLQAQKYYAQAFIDAGRPARGAGILEAALRWNPDDIGLLNNLGRAYLLLGRTDRARELLLRAAELDPQQATTLINLATCHTDLDRLDEALRYADRAVRLAPRLARAHLVRGRVLMRLERYQEAYDATRAAVALQTRDPLILLQLGDACLRLDRPREARERFEALVRLAPTFGPGYLHLCEACLALGQLEDAKAAYAVAARFAPTRPEVKAMGERLRRAVP